MNLLKLGRAGSAELVFPNLVILVIISQLRSCERASSTVVLRKHDSGGLHKSVHSQLQRDSAQRPVPKGI